MNIAIGTKRSTWKGPKGRYFVGIAGLLLAAGITYAGISSLPESDNDGVAVRPIASQPQPLFPTSADAVFALESGVAVTPQFATMADAAAALPVPASGEIVLSQSAPQFATMADAVAALPTLPSEVSPVVVEQPLSPEAEAFSAGIPAWETTLADRPVAAVEQPLTPEAEALSAGISPYASLEGAWEAMVP
jgi:hypothetical protein